MDYVNDLGERGVWYAADKLSIEQWRDVITRIEHLGYGTLWYSESTGFESMSLGSHLLSCTQKLNVGSSIASIYARDAVASRSGLRTLSELSSGRFVLGLGVSHIPLVERFRGHNYGKPLGAMREYLEAIRHEAGDANELPIVVAALGPRMLELAAELTMGAIPYNVTPEHTSRAKSILGPEKWLAVEQKICFEADAKTARDLARKELERYMSLPNYRNNWLRLGFSDADLDHGGSDRFLDAMVVWGDQSTIERRLCEHVDAGATHVCIQPVHPAGDVDAMLRALEAFAL